jgi:hypothetical protein
MNSTNLLLVRLGFGAPITFTITSFNALRRTGFSWLLWVGASRAESAYVRGLWARARGDESFVLMAVSLFRISSWAAVVGVPWEVLSSNMFFFQEQPCILGLLRAVACLKKSFNSC